MSEDSKAPETTLERTVNTQVHFILNPLSYDHNILRGFVDEGVGNDVGDVGDVARIESTLEKNNGQIHERSSSSVRVCKTWVGERKNAAKECRVDRRRDYREEVYTDKDRAAAVNMGSKDIKHSLRIKGKEERVRSASGLPEEMEPSSLLVRALRQVRCGNIESGIATINQVMDYSALEVNPKDRNALIARCRCYLLLGEPRKALEDAEAILERETKDSSYARAIYYKAEALYQLGCFEMSLVYYSRGQRIRPELDQFRLGVQKATNAISQLLCKK